MNKVQRENRNTGEAQKKSKEIKQKKKRKNIAKSNHGEKKKEYQVDYNKERSTAQGAKTKEHSCKECEDRRNENKKKEEHKAAEGTKREPSTGRKGELNDVSKTTRAQTGRLRL